MSTSYGGANTYHATITIPEDGDLASAASVNAAFQALKDIGVFAINKMVRLDELNAMTGAGRIRSRVATGPDADANISVTSQDVLVVPAVTANRVYTLQGCSAGDEIEFVNLLANTANYVDLAAGAGVTIATPGTPFAFRFYNSTGGWASVRFRAIATNVWYFVGGFKIP